MNERDKIIDAITYAEAELAALTQARDLTIFKLEKLRTDLDLLYTTDKTAFTQYASPKEKVQLFANLFRGRDDVFARLWMSHKTGKKGFSPVCEYEWQPEICTKPAKKCTHCKYVPLTNEALQAHLEGRHVIGIYPLRQDETCYFLTIDLDKDGWKEDAAAFLEVCKSNDVPAALERSRSGNGGHVWIFFTEPIPAVLARNMGSYLLTETMSRHHQLSMASYDRLFPNQDTMPKGGFGNLIALPLQKEARKSGNTEFLDAQFQPYADQWTYLASIRKMNLHEVQTIANEATKTNRVTGVAAFSPEEENTPWRMPPARQNILPNVRNQIPPRLNVTLADQLYVEKAGLPSALLAEIKRLAAFQNPKFYEAQHQRRSTFQIPRIISCAEEFSKHLAVPRGCLEPLRALLYPLDITIEIADERLHGVPFEVEFHGKLNVAQQNAIAQISPYDIGILVAPPGSGKTVMGIYLIVQRRLPTLVLVHRQTLLEQWRNRLAEFLNLSPEQIGYIGGGKDSRTGRIDVAMLQSLVRKSEVDPLVGEYGHVIVDECHHIPAFSVEQVLKHARARYVTGLTATPYRRDGHDPIITMQCGPVRCRIDSHDAELHAFKRRLICRETGILVPDPRQIAYHELIDLLAGNKSRNQLIISDVTKILQEGRSPIVLSERRDHVELLRAELANHVKHLIVLHGGKGEKERHEIQRQLAEIPENEARVILATGAYAGEGFDDHRLDTLLLALPISFKGKLEQYAGRILRPHSGKDEVQIYDYVDGKIPMLSGMFKKRLKAYRAMKYFQDEEFKRPLAKMTSMQLQLPMVA